MIVTFVNSLYVEEIDDVNWRVIAPFIVDVISISEQRLTVPMGFETDFASVPRIGAVYALFGNRAHRAAVVHDYLYSLGGSDSDRAYADDVLRAGCIADGLDAGKAEAMWAAVRQFGGSHWPQPAIPG